MPQYQFKPDITAKFSPRIAKSTAALIGKVCRRHEMFEADVLRFGLEAIAPEAARRGIKWLIRQIPNFDSVGKETLSTMFTVRTSKKVKGSINAMAERQPGEYSEADILRFCYLAILPVALREGFGPIMEMREKNLRA